MGFRIEIRGLRNTGGMFQIPVLPRLLLHQQMLVTRHQVDTPLQSQMLTDEGRL